MENVFADFLQNGGLYETITVTEDNVMDFCSLLGGKIKISIFCPKCKENRVFTMKPVTFRNNSGVLQKLGEEIYHNYEIYQSCKAVPGEKDSPWHWYTYLPMDFARILTLTFECAMDPTAHKIYFIVRADGDTLIKIGQYPTYADLTFPELNQYKKVLSREDMKDLHRAIGLFASGIGAGSYVYLRRVIERMVVAAKSEAITSGKLTAKDFEGVRFSDQIVLLKDALPEILVGNSTVYGIVSKGIHELSEEDCISYFPILKECIFSIAEEWEAIRVRKLRQKEMNSALSRIANQVK